MDTEFDAVDWHILGVLQHDARISNRALADAIGLSPSACLARVRALQERGVIRGFGAEIDYALIGRPLQALIAIKLDTHARGVLDRFVDDLKSLPDTIGLFHLSGAEDYLLHVAVADPETLRDFVLDRLTVRKEVAHVQTSLVFQHYAGTRIGPQHVTRRRRR